MKTVIDDEWAGVITRELPGVRDLRRALHRIPEPGFGEYETAAALKAFFNDIPDLVLKEGLAGTGFTVTLGSGNPGDCIAFRADMDALPIMELTGVDYASTHPGWMHACGHDGHSAILAGLVRVLGALQHRLRGPVKFIFQPAEEGGGGARYLVEQGVLKNPDVAMVFGLHGWPDLHVGEVGCRVGAFFASTDSFEIRIEGKGGHAAFPHKATDPIVAAAHVVTALQSLVSRETNPLESAVVSVTEIHGGTAFNVIPDAAVLRGTIRCFDEGLRHRLKERLASLAKAVCQGLGSSAELFFKADGYPALVCDERAVTHFRERASAIVGQPQVHWVPATMGGEDFAYYAREVPSCFWLLGVKDRGADQWPFLHTAGYDFNDDALETALKLQSAMVLLPPEPRT